jgi:hypothetical protein
MEDRAKSILTSARTYSKTAKYINALAQNDPGQLIPSFVISALALELYFKSIYFLDKNKEFKVKGRHSHDFYILFDELSENLKESLEQNFRYLTTHRDMHDVHIIESQAKVVIPRDLRGNLKYWSNVFTKSRYIHEKSDELRIVMFFPEIEQAIENIISDIRPEF